MLKSNEYFDGKVKSIAISTAQGPATVGVMEKGEYEFGTDKEELMVIISGCLKVKLPGDETYKTFTKDNSFKVLEKSKFNVVVEEDTAYMCYYK